MVDNLEHFPYPENPHAYKILQAGILNKLDFLSGNYSHDYIAMMM